MLGTWRGGLWNAEGTSLGAPLGIKEFHHDCKPGLGDFLLLAPSKSKEFNPGAEFLTPTSFKDVEIKFTPKVKEYTEQELKTEDDLAMALRQCEKDFGSNPDIEQPCKTAVINRYLGSSKAAAEEGEGGSCFPAEARVNALHRGELRLADLLIGDMVETCPVGLSDACDDVGKRRMPWARVVAWLHEDPRSVVPYLRITHTCGEICVSAAHLVRAQQDGPLKAEWKWIPAQDIAPGHLLFGGQDSCIVTKVQPEERQGMYAPLTESGTLLVDGILCSCYAPPQVYAVPHAVCHVAMAPLRAFYEARRAVETWDVDEDGKPLFTIEVVHPWRYDPLVHPYASVLLCLTEAVASIPSKLLGLNLDVLALDERVLKLVF